MRGFCGLTEALRPITPPPRRALTLDGYVSRNHAWPERPRIALIGAASSGIVVIVAPLDRLGVGEEAPDRMAMPRAPSCGRVKVSNLRGLWP